MEESYSLEEGKLGSWPFDPLSDGLEMLGQEGHPKPMEEGDFLSPTCCSSYPRERKLLEPTTLTLTPLTPTPTSVIQQHIQSHKRKEDEERPYMRIYPLVLNEKGSSQSEAETEEEETVQILTSCFNTNLDHSPHIVVHHEPGSRSNGVVGSANSESVRLPTFDQIHSHGKLGKGSFTFERKEEGMIPNEEDIYLMHELNFEQVNGGQGSHIIKEEDIERDTFMEDVDALGVGAEVEVVGGEVKGGDKGGKKRREGDVPSGDENGEGDSLKAQLKCKYCGFVCCSKSSLGIHERRHTGEKPYKCKFCEKSFNSAQCCKHHERLHTGDKPFSCKYCDKTYAVSTRLKRHERVHTREEPYVCEVHGCAKRFRWFDAFRDHRNTHRGVVLYLCKYCGKTFTSYLKFYYHQKGHELKAARDEKRKLQAIQNQSQPKGQKQKNTPKPRDKNDN